MWKYNEDCVLVREIGNPGCSDAGLLVGNILMMVVAAFLRRKHRGGGRLCGRSVTAVASPLCHLLIAHRSCRLFGDVL